MSFVIIHGPLAIGVHRIWFHRTNLSCILLRPCSCPFANKILSPSLAASRFSGWQQTTEVAVPTNPIIRRGIQHPVNDSDSDSLKTRRQVKHLSRFPDNCSHHFVIMGTDHVSRFCVGRAASCSLHQDRLLTGSAFFRYQSAEGNTNA